MMDSNVDNLRPGNASRRDFLKLSVAGTLGAGIPSTLALARSAYAAGSDVIRLALIGCGGRGTGAAVQALQNKATKGVKLVAMADAFQDRLEGALKRIQTRCGDQVDVPPERRFVGFDCHEKAIEAGVDMVLLCTPPGFRPMQFEAAVKAGKHVFMEKPVAVDAPGVRRILAANEEAKRRGLVVGVGLNIRHQKGTLEIVRRVHEGVLGPIHFLRAYCNNAGVWVRRREPQQTEMEYQMRNWYYFNWLCGDHIVEQHVHALDLVNWLAGAVPVRANGMGGRQVRVGPEYGEIYDHHFVEFEYPDGVRMFSQCRHIPGCWNTFGGIAHGTQGYADGTQGIRLAGKEPLQFERGEDGHQVEHDDLFAALLAGRDYNEGDYGAQSTMTAILGRMATYSGKVVTWDEALSSNLSLAPETLAWDAKPPVTPAPDGLYPCAIPGVSRAW